MPVSVRVVGQKFFAKLNNGDDFTINDTTDFALHLKGGILEEVKAVFNVQVEWYHYMSNYNQLYDSSANTLRLEQSGIDFSLQGFSIGDAVKLSAAGGNASYTGDVTSLNTGEIVLNNVVVVSGSPTEGYTTGIQGDDPLTGLTQKTALKYDFGLIENNEPFNTLSKLTNTNQSFLFEGIDHGSPLTFVDGESAGNNKAWVTGSMKCAFVKLVPDKDIKNTQDTTQEFQIEHIFKINPFYRDGEIDSLKGTDIPPLDIFNGDLSLKYVLKTEFRTVLTNPNTSMITDYDTQLGSVGYLDESYNGYKNNYSVENVVYTVNSNTTTQLEIGSITNVAFTLKSDTSTFTASTPVIVGHTAIVDSLAYISSPNDYDSVWTDENLRSLTGDSAKSGTLIKNYTASFVDAETIDVVFDIEFTGSQISILENNQDYLLYFTVQDPSKTVDTGDKVTGRIDVNFYFKNNDVEGLFDFDIFEQYPHPEEFEEGVSVGFTEALTFNESGMMANGRFWVLNTATLNDLKFDIAIFKFDDDTWNSIRSLVIDLSDQTTVGGVQQIELDTTRGYILKEDDIFNYLKITTDPTNDGIKQYYNIQVGYRMPWQSWLQFKDAPSIFYDKEKSNNGLNQKISNYSMVGTGDNTYTDGDGGTFEDNNAAGWGFTILDTPPQEIGNSFISTNLPRTGSFCCRFMTGADDMQEVDKVYSIFTNDNGISVIDGASYEISCYLSLRDIDVEPSHINNGEYYFLPNGYDKDEMSLIEPFKIIPSNLHEGVNPSFDDYKLFTTTFKAKTTGVVTFTLYEELQVDITTGTGANFNIDDLSFKAVEYGVKVLFDAVVDSTNYVKTSEEIRVYDYDEDDSTPSNFICDLQTYNQDGTAIAGNIIKSEYTEVKAIFTPLVPPSFTESVDMTEVADDWTRIAHGNELLAPATISPRIGDWTNEIADDDDIFSDIGGSPHTKGEAGLYTSTPSTIQTNHNCNAFYGCISLDQFEFYSINGKMFSDAADNDGLAYNVAFIVDEFGQEHTLSLIATTGGLLLDINPSFVLGNNQTSTMGFVNTVASWSLVYNFGKRDCKQLLTFDTTKAGFNWNNGLVGDLMFNVNRSSDEIMIDVDWTIDAVQFTNTFNYNLNDDPLTVKFRGFSNIGFSFMSQDDGGFKDVVLEKPEGDFYVEIRLDPKESQSDFTDNRISSDIEAPDNNLLTQITGSIKKATLSYDGISFIGQCLVDTSFVEKGQNYDFSTELRPIRLEKL